ncbi:MAG TPA: LPS assembly protein LptD, partial [Geobacteraceae bacterium]|nr:LPS assembly protein LptD [Geobacteraceae bacterium]
MVRRIPLFFLLLTALAAPAVAAEQATALQGEVRLQADRLAHEQNDDIIRADGNVELLWSGMKLYADMATYLRNEGVVKAEGKVKILKDGDVLTGDSARLLVGPRTGMVENGHLFVKKNNLHLRGSEIEKTGEQDYRIQQGSITSCDGEKPGWKFMVDDLKISMNDYATGRNAFFYLGETPVFWSPYVVFPVLTERQSGFFFPKFGNSSKKGAFLDVPYYWAISPSSDATFDLDLQSKRGAGVGVEYRYLSANRGHGQNHAYLIFDTQQDRFRGDLEMKQQLNFSDDTYWRADVNMTLDRDYYRDYGVKSGEYNKQYLGTSAFLSHRSESLLLTGGVDFVDDLEAVSNKETLQKLPYLNLMGTGAPIGSTPLYYSFDSSIVQMERDVGDRGQRFSLAPRLSYALPVSDWLSSRLWAGYVQRLYHATASTGADGWHGQGAAEGGISLQTELARTFAVSAGGMSVV